MSQPKPVRSRAPWIVAGGLGVLVALLVLVLVHVHAVSDNHAKDGGSGYGLTADQEQAVTAASTEAVNVVTFSRKTFNADFARALNGATGSLKSDLAKEKSLTLNTMTSGKYDLKGTVGSSAYAGTTDNGKGLLVLVTVNGFKVSDSAGEGSATVQRLELTMVKSGNKWLADDLTATGIE
jgi:Mce-associated membrane protein